ncbi:hypothetical protein BDR26DRAFT_594798 [Obelidium mucronatum]|nr:hypothetical protein BDR26DRAFT_594798 [Obelidium mucronatum]
MASYFEDKSMEDPEKVRLRQRNQVNSNPNLDDFMGSSSTASASRPTNNPSEGSTNSFAGLASIFSSILESTAVQSDGPQQQVLAGLISQLNQEAQFGTKGQPPASKFFTRNLPSVKGPSTPCAICVEPFNPTDQEDPAKTLPCKHIFHKKCLIPWLKLHNTCPFCRWEVPTDDAVYERGRKERQKVEAKKRGLVLEEDEDEDFMYG